MSWDLIKQEIGTKRAGEDMTAARGKAVVFNGLDRVQIAGLIGPFAGQAHGILTNNPESGGVATVQVFGVAKGRLGGAVAGGRYVDVAANGDLIENHPDGQVGIALEGGIAGSIVPIFLVNRTFAAGTDGVVISAVLVGDILTLGRSAALGDVTVDLSQYDDTVIVAVAQAAADAAAIAAAAAQADATQALADALAAQTDATQAISDALAAQTDIDNHQAGSVDDHGDVDTTTAPPSVNQVLGWDGSDWVPMDNFSFGEYIGAFDASIGTFPVTPNQGDWFNVTVAGTVDGQNFIPGDLLIALIDTPSTVTFAGNWSVVPNLSITDHTLLSNIGTNSHAAIDIHIADGSIHFTEASIDHDNIQNNGTISHADIDTRIVALELRTKSFVLENPVGSSEIFGWFFTDVAITVQQINFVVTGVPAAQLDVDIQFGPTRNAVGTSIITGGLTVTNMSTGQEVTVLDNAAIPADSWVQFRSNSPINSPDEIAITLIHN